MEYVGLTGGSDVPSTYTRLDHVIFTGEQFIDTGVNASNGFSADVTCTPTAWSSDGNGVIGITSTLSSPYICASCFTMTRDGYIFRYGATGGTYDDYNFNLNNRYDISVSFANTTGNLYVNGSELGPWLHIATLFIDRNIRLGAIYDADKETFSEWFKGKFHGVKMWVSGSLVRDFVPVQRKSDNAVGLYDKVNSVFYLSGSETPLIAGTAYIDGEINITPEWDTTYQILGIPTIVNIEVPVVPTIPDKFIIIKFTTSNTAPTLNLDSKYKIISDYIIYPNTTYELIVVYREGCFEMSFGLFRNFDAILTVTGSGSDNWAYVQHTSYGKTTYLTGPGIIYANIGDTLLCHASYTLHSYGYVYVNGVEVFKSSLIKGSNYNYTITGNATVELYKEDGFLDGFGRITITTT